MADKNSTDTEQISFQSRSLSHDRDSRGSIVRGPDQKSVFMIPSSAWLASIFDRPELLAQSQRSVHTSPFSGFHLAACQCHICDP